MLELHKLGYVLIEVLARFNIERYSKNIDPELSNNHPKLENLDEKA